MIYPFLYNFGISCYSVAIRVAAIWKPKAKLFIKGRKDLISRLAAAFAAEQRPIIWVHCASLGEFEQGRPVIEGIKAQHPRCCILVTFFSPSGYEVRKDYKGADHVFYLPTDTASHARQFVAIVNPILCIFVKYELWYNYLSAISVQKIPLLLISARFSGGQGFFKWYGGFQREMLAKFSHIFVQDENSNILLSAIGVKNVTVSGDTRFDSVVQSAAKRVDLPIAQEFCRGHRILIAGSTWPADEALICDAMSGLPEDFRIILVPHEVDESHIKLIEDLYEGNTVRWSKWTGESGKKVLLVDKVGFLMQLYKYGHVAWIGGGFGKEGIHNVLEAAVFGLPSLFGPIYHQFIEAEELIAEGGAAVVLDKAQLLDRIIRLSDPNIYDSISQAAIKYVNSKIGATNALLQFISHSYGI